MPQALAPGGSGGRTVGPGVGTTLEGTGALRPGVRAAGLNWTLRSSGPADGVGPQGGRGAPHLGARPRGGSREVRGPVGGGCGQDRRLLPAPADLLQKMSRKSRRRSTQGLPAEARPSCSTPNHFRYPEAHGGRWACGLHLPGPRLGGRASCPLPPLGHAWHAVPSHQQQWHSVHPEAWAEGRTEVLPQPQPPRLLCQRNTEPSIHVLYDGEKKYLMFPKKTVYFVLCKVLIK